jgi:peptidoglycan/xylan/chitin deacetylase (PgdA/CDA1 family)
MNAKSAVFALAKDAGLLEVVRDSEWRRRRLLILCYHGVSLDDEHHWNPELYMPAGLLRDRLRHLRDHRYTLLPLDEACRRLYRGTLPPRGIALTFDDGAIDFEKVTVPILQEFDAPATLYLTTYYVFTRLPVFNTILDYVLWRGRKSGGDVAPLCGAAERLPVGTPEEIGRAREALHEYAIRNRMSAQEKEHLVTRVAAILGVAYESIRASGILHLMAPETVRGLPQGLVDVQLHTHRHCVPQDRNQFRSEILENIRRIQSLRGNGVSLNHFCYPSGVFREDFLRWLPELGVEFATTSVPNIVTSRNHPLLLPRFVDTCNASSLTFEAWASGFAALLPKRRLPAPLPGWQRADRPEPRSLSAL